MHPTGPRTPEGKQRSSLNALRHGLTGHTVVIPSDDLQAYKKFCAEFFTHYAPVGPVESQLVQTIADTSWRLNRITAMEQSSLALSAVRHEDEVSTADDRCATAMASALAFEEHVNKSVGNLSIYEQRLSRQLERSLKLIDQTQAGRKHREKEQLAEAARLKTLHDARQANQKEPVAYNPAADGFVFSNDVIDAFRDRETRSRQALAFSQKLQKSAMAA